MKNVGVSYLLWAGILVGLGGLHRLYNGKILSGLLWLFTGGLFGIGQLIDLFFIPDMVEEHNLKFRLEELQRNKLPIGNSISLKMQGLMGSLLNSKPLKQETQVPLNREQLRMRLLKAAQAKRGQLSVTQGVMATGAPFKKVEAELKDMLKAGYVSIDNDPETGVVVYVFKEL
ncbi:MAG: NINE protein [Leptolyngbyaceae cyanobacterium MO_188.B28]|nr:NINE protein [Leptolyngbyaceae cyanobacterium MO_188.B28]